MRLPSLLMHEVSTDSIFPVLIDRSVFDLLRRADPAAGAKPVVRAHATPAGDVAVTDEGAFTDVDTPDEYERLFVR